MKTSIYKIFYSIIRAAISDKHSLNYTPSIEEWYEVFQIAKSQAMLGVCFYGIQQLSKDEIIHLKDDRLFNRWLGIVFQIQQRNYYLNRKCQEITYKLDEEGKKNCILKGQGVALLYKENLRSLRQSGDIDIWIDLDLKSLLKWSENIGKIREIGDHHITLYSNDNVEIEYHYKPCSLHNYFKNKKLQKWISQKSNEQFENKIITNDGFIFSTSTIEFNLVFLMSHMHRHFFGEGLGLRQVLDYYYVLCSNAGHIKVEDEFKDFGILSFSQGIMWILQDKFRLENKYLVCKPDQRVGSFILKEIEEGGNFGHNNSKRFLTKGASHAYRFLEKIIISSRYFRYFPSEFLWTPCSYAQEFLLTRKYRR